MKKRIVCLLIVLCALLAGCNLKNSSSTSAPDVIIDGINFGNKFDAETAEKVFHNLDYIDPDDTEKMMQTYEEDCIFRDANMKWTHHEDGWFRPGEKLILTTYYPGIEIGETWIAGDSKVDEAGIYTTLYMDEPIMYKTRDGRLVWVYGDYTSLGYYGLKKEIFYSFINLPNA